MNNDKHPARGIGYGLVIGAAGWLAVDLPDSVPYADLTAGGLITAGAAVAAGSGYAWYRRSQGSGASVDRLRRQARRNDGMATGMDMWKKTSSHAMRRRATVLRPSLADLSWHERWRLPTTAYAAKLAKVGRHTIWSPCEDVTVCAGGTRMGKSALLAEHILNAPAAVVATTTRKDLVRLTAAVRSQIGPIWLFNPNRMVDWASNIKWNPLIGCRDITTAQRRARDMIPRGGSDEAERWDVQGRRVLGLLMHAAALEGLPLRAVLAWMADAGPTAAAEVEGILTRRAADVPEVRSLRTSVKQFFATNDRTKSSIITTVMPALSWLTDPRAAQLGDADVTDDLLDVPGLIAQRGTLYLLGSEDGITAPLLAALAGEIEHQARWLAGHTEHDRLDPPLTMVLDEAFLSCPVPLDVWTADMGGKGITLHIGVQGRSQLRRKWGEMGAADILNNAGSLLVFGNTKDPDDLAAWEKLSGERVEITQHFDADGKITSYSERTVPVLTAAQIRQLPEHHAMIVRRGMPVVVGRTPRAWKRWDVRRANRRTPYTPIKETNYGAENLAVAEESLAGESVE